MHNIDQFIYTFLTCVLYYTKILLLIVCCIHYELKMIRVGDDTDYRLKRYGIFGELFEGIINRLMDIAEVRKQ